MSDVIVVGGGVIGLSVAWELSAGAGARWPMKRVNRRRIAWIALGAAGAVLLVVAVIWHRSSAQHFQPWQFLAHVVQVEQGDLDPSSLQALGWSLAILGRDDEVRGLDFFPQFERPASTLDFGGLDLQTVPWRDGIQQIAAEHRIVMVMEDHFVSKHREFIGATLPLFNEAGFTHHAAEAIGPVDTSLAARGYPTSFTGLYTSDPQFGNVLRRALELDFDVVGYDFRPFTHEGREEFAATRLAALFEKGRETKLLVHAGHAHVLKYETEHGGRWLAARLWEKTGIEPFTIWQWSSSHDARDYAAVVRALEDRGVSVDEPILLMPPPRIDCGLQDSPYGLAAVDAIVVHPPDESAAPDARTALFPESMQRVAGVWTGNVWPVVVCAYQKGEPVDAVPLDQVMLREHETGFLLWVPAGAEYRIRVFDRYGLLKSQAAFEETSICVGLEEPL